MLRSEPTRRELIRQYTIILSVVACYWVVSISTVFVNKTLLSSRIINLDAPVFVTWTQCIISTLICYALKTFSQISTCVSFPKSDPFNLKTFLNIFPLCALFILMITFNNLCLNYVGVSFYFVSRSLTTVFNVVFSYALLGQTTSSRALLCCSLIIAGFWLGVDQENFVGSFSLKGTVYGVLGSISLCLYSIHTKKVLPYVNDQILLLSYYNNLYAIVLFLPIIYLNGDFDSVSNFDFLIPSFWVLTLVGGICGFLIGFVTTLQIKVTSPLTHNISGTAKACAQTVLATSWYNESKPWLWWLSNMIVLFGSASYARVKQLEMAHAHKAKKPTVA